MTSWTEWPSASALRHGSCLLACLLLAGASFVLWPRGILDEETTQLVPGYWANRGVAERVFDPAANDFGAYQARELSYAVDLVDASALRALLARGRVSFVPLSGIALPLLVVSVVLLGRRSALPALPPWLALLATALFLSNFVVPTSAALFYRSAKSATALLLLALLFRVCAVLRSPRSASGAALASFALATATSLCDRQGFYETLVLAAVLVAVLSAIGRGRAALAGTVAALALAVAYDLWLAPRIVHALNGYWPSFAYQRLPWHKLANPRFYREGTELALRYTSALFGSLPPSVLLGAGLVAGALLWRTRAAVLPRETAQDRSAPPADRPVPGAPAWLVPSVVGLVAASQVALFAGMVIRLRAVYEIPEWLAYYALPFQALLLFGLLLLLEVVARRGGAARRIATIALAGLACANVAHWPERRAAMAASPAYGETLRRSALLRDSLRDGRLDPRLAGMHREFYWDCRDRFPVLFPAAVEVRERDGFLRTTERASRTFAWARSDAAVDLRAPRTGDYRLALAAFLQPGDELQLDGPGAPRALAAVRSPGGWSEPPFTTRAVYSFELRLPAGVTRVRIRSQARERVVDAERGLSAAFGVDFPIILYRLAGQSETPEPDVGSSAPRS